MEKTSEILEELRACMTPRMEGIEKGEFEVFDMAELTSLGEKYNNHKVGVSKTETPTPTDKDYLVVGNGAKMREALEQIRDSVYIDHDDNKCHSDIDESDLREICDVALSTPPRNCDKFVNELDAQIEFLNEVWLISVDKDTMLERDKFENWTEEMKSRYAKWLFAEAEGETK